ncbi:Antibiotic biosynthesis monooxygenase [Euzebya pacifica]|uniref:Antibiotic biosynthesis monooxygenase n=1 Tax=Euzebya pacifica TaxID=1608957 RepID=A0A346XT84_9ACTN|nr:antibiotic biosynthesis monooxygenase [Euzebya pacifica]AXV05431.1 Antibiotic biosynthesis monooxygenase [Euzebya pacifica]
MSDHPFVAFNVLTVPEPMRETLEERFAKRAGEVEKMDGFEHFELLRPVAGTDKYLVYTRWKSKDHFDAWVNSMQFGKGHAQASQDGREGGPAASGSEVWSFEAIQTADAAGVNRTADAVGVTDAAGDDA